MFDFASFLPRAVMQGIPLLYGSTGEILTEKSGNLNLGIPGVMYVGGICGVIGAFFYEQAVPAAEMSALAAIGIPMLCSLAGSLLMGLIYCLLTVTLRANQNVTGLALTTFGVGVGNFFGGSLIKLTGSEVPVHRAVRNQRLLQQVSAHRRDDRLVRSGLPVLWLPGVPRDHHCAARCLLPQAHARRVFICAPSARAPPLPTQPVSTSRSTSTSRPASAA